MEQKNSDDYQADASASALSEKFNVRSEWLPIETAPKDGTVIDLWVVDSEYPFRKNEHRISDCSWRYDDEEWFDLEGRMLLIDMGFSPTHWMPLPSPPGAELNFSNDAESDGVSLKSDTSLKDSEA